MEDALLAHLSLSKDHKGKIIYSLFSYYVFFPSFSTGNISGSQVARSVAFVQTKAWPSVAVAAVMTSLALVLACPFLVALDPGVTSERTLAERCSAGASVPPIIDGAFSLHPPWTRAPHPTSPVVTPTRPARPPAPAPAPPCPGGVPASRPRPLPVCRAAGVPVLGTCAR